MADSVRRDLLKGAAASLTLLVARPAFAQSQIIAVGKVVLTIIDGMTVAYYIAKGVIVTFGQSPGSRCAVTVNELEDFKYQCQAVGLAATGAATPLKTYLDKNDPESWRQTKIALGVLLDSGQALMATANTILNALGPDTYPGAKEDIAKLYQGLVQIRAALSVLARLPDKPEPEAMEIAKTLAYSIGNLPDLANLAVGELDRAVEDRQKAKC